MSDEYNIRTNIITISEGNYIIEEEKNKDAFFWTEVTFKSGNESFYLGPYYPYSHSSGREWMEYNSDYIVLMKDQYGNAEEDFEYCDHDNMGYIGPYILKIFDIKSKQCINGTEEELFEIYNNSFKSVCKKKTK